MKHPFKYWILRIAPVFVLLIAAFTQLPGHITVYMTGDSTMSIKAVKAYPETGWGMPFVNFFDSTVTVTNYAQNGRSTKTFISDKLWQKIADNVKPGDYVIIQFGHNDEVPTKAAATTESQFKENLLLFVNQTRAKQATPILLTPTARRKFDSTGTVVGTHDVYAAIVRTVAAEQNVAMIDVDKESQALIQKYGPEDSKIFYDYLTPGENPNYPRGNSDDTHFSDLGARKIASI